MAPTELQGTEAAVDVAGPPKSTDWQTYRRLFGYVSDQLAWFLLALLGFLLTAAGEVGFAKVFGLIVDAVQYPMPSFVWVFPVMMLTLALVRAFGTVTGDYTLSRISFRAIHVIRSELFERLMLMPSKFFDGSARGHLVSRLTFTTAQLRDTTTDALKIIISDGLKVIVYLTAMFVFNWLLTVIFLAISPLVGVIVRYASRRFRRLSKRIQGSMGDVTHVAAEAVAGYREVKIFRGESYERDRFRRASERNRRQNLKMATTKATSAQVIQCLAAGGLAALVGLVFMPDIGGGMSPGDLAYYLGIAGMLANPIKKLSDVNARLQRGLAAATEIFEQIDEPAEEDSGALEVDRVAGEIRFEKVSFSYDLARPSVLDKVSFSIAAGQTVALVGKSGAGKTTLANLIARFYQPTGGRILLDGKPLASYRLSCVRRQIALVSQDVTLFNDTLANNIAYGGLAGAGRDAIATAARRAHADEFIDSMPRGLDTIVGDDGVLLSGGQRQRVAIARALLKDAPVLILDEATSSLDAHSERYVQAALEEVMRDRTTILIAHRLSTVEKADLIVVVEGGAIVESGTHATLMAGGGAYADLYRSQFDSGVTDPPPAPKLRVPMPLPVAPGTFGPLVDAWYSGRYWPRLLWPLAAVFGWLVKRRRRRYLAGLTGAWRARVPVVVVGNVTVGGTGKTPLVIWLARWLAGRGLAVGVVSRGYGGQASYPLVVDADTPAVQCGDEAGMIARRAGCPVVVDPDRPRAVRKLLSVAEIDVVLADDGLQHYALYRDVEVAVVDGARGIGNGLCLPAGPLREPVTRLRDCHWVVANGAPSGLAGGESVMVAEASAMVNLATGERVAPQDFSARHGAVVAVAGIGNPDRFQTTLNEIGLTSTLRAFPDHHVFTAKDVAVASGGCVVVTEKDAEKLKSLDESTIGHCWYLEIDVRFTKPVDDFLDGLLAERGVIGRTVAHQGAR